MPEPVNVSVESTPAPATSAASPATATPVAPAPSVAIPQTPQAPATGAAPDGYVPSYRLRETREAAVREANEQFAQREAQYQQRLQQIQNQLHALVGVNPPQNPEVDAVRQQFAQLYPGLSKMEEKAAQLEQLLERAGDIDAQNQHYWTTYGRQSMDRLFAKAQESFGVPLTDEGRRALHSSFTGFVSSSPELTERYSNDPTIVDDFWKMFSSSFIDPIRRGSAANVVARAGASSGIPQDTPSGAPRATLAPKPADLDERANLAWAQYQSTNKQQ